MLGGEFRLGEIVLLRLVKLTTEEIFLSGLIFDEGLGTEILDLFLNPLELFFVLLLIHK